MCSLILVHQFVTVLPNCLSYHAHSNWEKQKCMSKNNSLSGHAVENVFTCKRGIWLFEQVL